MFLLLIPIFFISEFYVSFKVGHEIGFGYSLLWVIMAIFFGIFLLKTFQISLVNRIFALKDGEMNLKDFKNATLFYFLSAVFFIIPGVLSDVLALLALIYTFFLQFVGTIPSKRDFNKKEGDKNVIDVEVVESATTSNPVDKRLN
ncbi:MAG: FxsA family protein [Sulfurovum sp.]|nr:MAG: FxsA family protein [Sulfurovum sp.]